MSFASELAALSRKRQDVVVISLDTCNLVWGTAPCTASTGDKCYNTYSTCDDKPNYDKRSKPYYFTNIGASNFNVPTARPYIKEISDLPTELKENGTVTKRLKVKFADEPELTDTAMDKYYSDRGTIQGTFWNKLIARNPNYKGRIIELYEGFDSLAFADYSLKFVGKIENITIGNGYCEVEAIDLLRSLEDIEFPVARNIELTEKMYRMFNSVQSQAEMLALPAEQYDWAYRVDFQTLTTTPFTPTDSVSGLLVNGFYDVHVVAYNSLGRPIAQDTQTNIELAGISDDSIACSWSAFSGAATYRIWLVGAGASYDNLYIVTAGTSYTIGTSADSGNLYAGTIPGNAQRYFELTGTDPTDIGDWTDRTASNVEIDVDSVTGLAASGYIQIDEEIIYYASISSLTLRGLTRGHFNTNSETTHESGTQIYSIAAPATGNPFQMLQDLLTLGNIASGYIASAFSTLEAAWTGINFSFLPYSKKKKLSDIYFNAVRSLDCISWVGEDGKITIKALTNTTVAGNLNDTENIISGSLSRDLNEESRYTRWLMHWNRFDGTKDIDDKESYNDLRILVDADAESVNLYNDMVEDIFFSAFISDTGNTAGDASDYVDALQALWKTRTKQAQEVVSLAVELKDSGYVVGDIVTLTTTRLQDINGNGYSAVKFLITKKEPMGSRINLTLKRIYE